MRIVWLSVALAACETEPSQEAPAHPHNIVWGGSWAGSCSEEAGSEVLWLEIELVDLGEGEIEGFGFMGPKGDEEGIDVAIVGEGGADGALSLSITLADPEADVEWSALFEGDRADQSVSGVLRIAAEGYGNVDVPCLLERDLVR